MLKFGEPTTLPASSASETLPERHQSWLKQVAAAMIPVESAATCSACAMCKTDSTTTADLALFSPSTKCCTYYPALRNFSVGAIFRDSRCSPQATEELKLRVRARSAVSPLGVLPLPSWSARYNSVSKELFGKSEVLLCSYYDKGAQGANCTIWRYRSPVCATWFCKHVRGATGQRFWSDVKRFLEVCEEVVALSVALHLGITPSILAQLVREPSSLNTQASELDGSFLDSQYRAQWGEWQHREIEFFEACAELADRTAAADVLRLGGVQLETLAGALGESYSSIVKAGALGQLRRATFSVSPAGEGKYVVGALNSYDPLLVTRDVVEVLAYFDGTPTAQVRARIEDECGLSLDDALLRRLVDFGLLTETA